MRYNLPKFIGKPFVKTSLDICKYPVFLTHDFKKTYDNLPDDAYLRNKTRQRRYAHYSITNIKGNDFTINHEPGKVYRQNVRDGRSSPRIFPPIEQPYDLFVFYMLQMTSQLVINNHPTIIKEMTIDVHQVRQICYPGIDSHNSMEGIHRDGCDYIISACVLNRHNICGGESYVYNLEKNEVLFSTTLEENEFIFQDDVNLRHYVTPIQYLLKDSITSHGYRDIIGLDINII